MRNFPKRWLLSLLVLAAFWLMPTLAHAQSLEFSALKYNTDQTSMASGYFVHPASVTVKNHAYVVTMDIKTAKKLTDWPVTVLSIDGQAPANVRKEKDAAGNSHLYYAFTTTDLKRDVTAKLSIDVPKVYKAKHLITFKFKTNNLPSLGSKTPTTTAKVTSSSRASSSSSSKAATPAAAAKASSSAKAQAKSRAKSSAKAKAKASKSSSSRSSSSTASQSASSAQQSGTTADEVPAQKTHWGGLIGGIVAIIVLVGGGGLWYVGRGRH